MTLFIQNRISEEIKDKKFTQNNQDTINNKISKFLESTKILRLWNLGHLISNLLEMNIELDPLFFEVLEKN